MSENNNLSDDLNDMIGDAKDTAKQAADKASDFANEAKEKASEFADDAKKKFDEFAGEAKDVLSDGKNMAIIAHIHLVGWIIAFFMNKDKNNDYAKFYLRQTLGLYIVSFLAYMLLGIPFIGMLIAILFLILWVMSLIGALSGEKKLLPIVGDYFQDWFKSL